VASIYLPPWRIDVSVRPGVKPSVPRAALARVAARSLSAADAPSPASLAIILSNDRELADLNVRHMGHDGPTDVLSFPLLLPADFPPHAGRESDARRERGRPFIWPPDRRLHLGDIVVSVERAIAQAPDQGWSAADELRQLIVHGVLHVCGWDHASIAERDAMRALESAVLDAR
jgi:probable rRNA maturation factor